MEISILISNFFYITTQGYFAVIDKLALSRVCKEFRKIYSVDIVEAINRELAKRIPLNLVGNFIPLLKKYGYIISGSFLLQVLYGEDWKSDIDIYKVVENYGYKKEFKETFGNDLKQYGYHHTGWDVDDDEMILIDNKLKNMLKDRTILTSKYGCIPMESMRLEHIDFKKNYLNIIHVNELMVPNKMENLKEYIDYYFDIDICKINFDGYKLRFKNLDDLIKKKSYVNTKLDRLYENKYNEMTTDNLNKLKKRQSARIDKYQKRGFQLE